MVLHHQLDKNKSHTSPTFPVLHTIIRLKLITIKNKVFSLFTVPTKMYLNYLN